MPKEIFDIRGELSFSSDDASGNALKPAENENLTYTGFYLEDKDKI